MEKVLTANLLFINETVWLVKEGFQKNQFIDTNNNVWQANEIQITGWTYMKNNNELFKNIL